MVVKAAVEHPRPALARVERVGEGNGVLSVFHSRGPPVPPPREPVDGPALVRLAQVKLQPLAFPLVAAALDAVGPWNQRLAPRASAHLVRTVPVQQGPAVQQV